MNRMSMLFAALLAATFAFVPGHAPEAPQATQRNATVVPARKASAAQNNKTAKPREPAAESPLLAATNFLSDFLGRGDAFGGDGAPRILFATVADPVETHLAAAFDHDVAAIQDGIQDSGYLFDSSWILWDIPQGYDSYEDEVSAEQSRNVKHDFPGILLFRGGTQAGVQSGAKAEVNPYFQGLIVFLLTEKPTAGINVRQAQNALKILIRAVRSTGLVQTTEQLSLPGPVLIAGPTYSGSFNSLVPLVSVLRQSQDIQPPKRFLIRSSGFTSCSEAVSVAHFIAQRFNAQVDMGSANHPFDAWIELVLRTLENVGINRQNVAVLSEGQSLFGHVVTDQEGSKRESSSSKTENKSDAKKPRSENDREPDSPCLEFKGDKTKASPSYLQFPRDISALRSSYEKQGLLDMTPNPDIGKRALHLNAEEARNGDSIRMFGTDETVAAQESVLFGISEFVRSHEIHAVVIVATSEEDSYFLTRFLHANVAGLRVVVSGATRLFMRGPTGQFRGDMMVSSFPLLPRLHDWTGIVGEPQDPAYHVFPNDSSVGEFMAVRDLLWNPSGGWLPHEYSLPDWKKDDRIQTRPPIYIVALGGDAAWPIGELDLARGVDIEGEVQPGPSAGVGKAAPRRRNRNVNDNRSILWRLSMPFAFGDHLRSQQQPLNPRPGWDFTHNAQQPTSLSAVESSGDQTCGQNATAATNVRHASDCEQAAKAFRFEVHAGRFWQLAFWICVAVPLSYCYGIWYADPVRRTKVAYLQPATDWLQWILLASFPALLSEVSFLVLARYVSFPPDIQGDVHAWCMWSLVTSLIFPLLILGLNAYRGYGAGCFRLNDSQIQPVPSLLVFVVTLVAAGALFHLRNMDEVNLSRLSWFLYTYREMHWESGLSLLPTILLLILAMSLWNYEAIIGVSVLHARPRLPEFREDDRISDRAARRIVEVGHPIPLSYGSPRYWSSVLVASAGIALALANWPSMRSISSLSPHSSTIGVLLLAAIAVLLMLMDILQFAWLWGGLHDLLDVLNRQPFKRSFIPLHDFDWNSIWSFSGGSFQERRRVLAAQVDCAFEISVLEPTLLHPEEDQYLHDLRTLYSKLDLGASLAQYRSDLILTQELFARIGSRIARNYPSMLAQTPLPPACAPEIQSNDRPFRTEEVELEHLPRWLRVYERFLCLLYVAFIRTVIARLRTLAISIVLVFSLIGLALAIYPFEPSQPLFIAGAAALLPIAGLMFVVFSQMDRDPILARILQSNPNKLEWSFYGKFIDTLALPLLTLLSSLLPGGAGRLIDLLRMALGHPQ